MTSINIAIQMFYSSMCFWVLFIMFVLAICFAYFLTTDKKFGSSNILILGNTQSGKTTLFYKVLYHHKLLLPNTL